MATAEPAHVADNRTMVDEVPDKITRIAACPRHPPLAYDDPVPSRTPKRPSADEMSINVSPAQNSSHPATTPPLSRLMPS